MQWGSGAFTDMLIHQGEPIRLKSARGIVNTRDLSLPGCDLDVEEADIQHFFTHYVEGGSTVARAGTSYWHSNVLPQLAQQRAVNRALPTEDGRFMRFSLFQHQRGKLAMVIRVTSQPAPLESIGLTPQIVHRIMHNPRGLLIITGPTASGKTATALSILDWMNKNRPGHIISIEDPIEYPMKADKCVFTQREVGVDVPSFGEGLRDAMRHSPDAILAGEVRDKDTAEAAVLGGESGALMLVTTHGRSVTGTLRKILTLTGDSTASMREVMAGSLIGVVRQELVPLEDGSNYCMVCDTLHMTDSVRQSVEKGDWAHLDKLTNNVAIDSPDFVPMSVQIDSLRNQGIKLSSAALQAVGHRGSKD